MSASNKKNTQDNTINITNLIFANTLQEVKREKKENEESPNFLCFNINIPVS